MTRGKWVHPAWKVLGIAPTGDTRAIRVAYSAKLKGIDPEAEPKAFIALREAFEAAKVQAQWVDLPDEDDEEAWDEEDSEDPVPAGDLYQIRPSGHVPDPPPPDPAWEAPAPSEAAAPPAPEEPQRRSPWAGVTPEDADAHSRALATLLYTHDRQSQPWPTAEQEEAMLAHWRAIAADPRMQEVAYFADADRWFSELIARTAAFSDPLIIPATEFFGWRGSDGAITQSPAVAYVTRRYRMLEFQREVKQPKHPLNPAWRELIRPAGNRPRRGSVSRDRVLQLLRTVRTNFPDLEGCFDAERVALWDGTHIGTGTGSGGDWSTYAWIIGLLLFAAIRLAASFSSGSSYEPPRPTYSPPAIYPQDNVQMPMQIVPPSPAPDTRTAPSSFPIILNGELGQSDADLDQALGQLYGETLDIATVATRDPELYAALGAFWAREKAAGVRKGKFVEHLSDFLAHRYPSGIRIGDPALFYR
jgi:hypothetical protein